MLLLKSLRRQIRRARWRHLRKLATIRRETKAAVEAAIWDDDTIRQQLDVVRREHAKLAEKVGAIIAVGSKNDLVLHGSVLDLNGRLREIERRLGVAGPVELELDLSAIAKG